MPCVPVEYFVGPVDEDLLCSLCGCVMDRPLQMPCGHDRGYECHQRVTTTTATTATCDDVTPCRCGFRGCDHVLPSRTEPLAEIPRLARIIGKMTVECFSGCGWTGPLSSQSDHNCPREMLPCTFKCGNSVERQHMAAHRATCEFRTEACPYCYATFRSRDMALHDERCALKEVPCDLCGALVRRGDMRSHLLDVCPRAMTACPFQPYGCPHRMHRAEVENHVTESLAGHCAMLVTLVDTERKRSADEISALRQRIAALEAEVSGKATTTDGTPLSDAISQLMRRGQAVEQQVKHIMQGHLLTVDGSGACGVFQRIQDALRRCRPGDTIVVRPGAYHEVVELTSPEHDDITIQGAGVDATFITGRVVVRGAQRPVVRNVSVMNRADRDAPAIRVVDGGPHFSDVHVTSINVSCCVVDGGRPTFDRVDFADTQQYGLWWKSSAELTVDTTSSSGDRSDSADCTGCQFSECREANVLIERGFVRFDGCDAFKSGAGCGVVVRQQGKFAARDCAFRDNPKSNVDCEGDVSLLRCSIFRSMKCGVLVRGDHGSIDMQECRVFENALPNVLVLAGGTATLSESKVLSGLQHGVVVKAGGRARLWQCVVSNNSLDNVAAEDGGTVEL